MSTAELPNVRDMYSVWERCRLPIRVWHRKTYNNERRKANFDPLGGGLRSIRLLLQCHTPNRVEFPFQRAHKSNPLLTHCSLTPRRLSKRSSAMHARIPAAQLTSLLLCHTPGGGHASNMAFWKRELPQCSRLLCHNVFDHRTKGVCLEGLSDESVPTLLLLHGVEWTVPDEHQASTTACGSCWPW
jgi:hypothetical protein